jgi:hypothetical protein
MAGRVAPYIDNTGLVFAYDQANIVRSYLGEPTTNFVPGTYGYTTYAYVSGPVDTTVFNEKNQLTTVKRYTITEAINTARARILPSGLTTGVAYTFSFKWKYNGTTTASPSVGIDASKGNPEGGANNNSFTSATTNTVSIGNGWYLSTYTFVFSSVPTGQCMLTFGIVTGSTAGFVGETFDIYEAQFEIKNHRTQYSNGTRSATQGLKDLTAKNTIDISTVSFDSNAQMTFDGSDDHILTSENIALNGSQTFEVITTISGGPQSPAGIISNHDYANTSNFGLNHISGNRIGISIGYTDNSREYDSKYTTYTATVGTPFHLVMTFDQSSNTVKLYINGVLDSTFVLTKTVKFTSRPVVLGRWDYQYNYYYFNGKIPVAKAYNRALSAADVTQNFNAVRGRYGI